MLGLAIRSVVMPLALLIGLASVRAEGPSPTEQPTRRPGPSVVPQSPPIESLLKPSVYRKVLRARDVAVHAKLGSAEGSSKRYEIYAAMLSRASLRRSREVLMDYR